MHKPTCARTAWTRSRTYTNLACPNGLRTAACTLACMHRIAKQLVLLGGRLRVGLAVDNAASDDMDDKRMEELRQHRQEKRHSSLLGKLFGTSKKPSIIGTSAGSGLPDTPDPPTPNPDGAAIADGAKSPPPPIPAMPMSPLARASSKLGLKVESFIESISDRADPVRIAVGRAAAAKAAEAAAKREMAEAASGSDHAGGGGGAEPTDGEGRKHGGNKVKPPIRRTASSSREMSLTEDIQISAIGRQHPAAADRLRGGGGGGGDGHHVREQDLLGVYIDTGDADADAAPLTRAHPSDYSPATRT